MTDELLAYLLDDLPEDRRAAVERRLQVDPQWRRELERLRECLGHADDPAPEGSPPSEDLVDRTCCLVEQVCGRPASAEAAFSESNEVSSRSRWSLADLAIATGVLLIGASLLLPALRQNRDLSRRAACQDNLQRLGTALFDYARLHHGRLPYISLRENAGAYAVKLADAKVIGREELASRVVCPEAALADQVRTRRVTITIPSRDQLEQADARVLIRLWRSMGGSYAYRFGFFDEDGKYHQVKFTGSAYSPMLADAPNFNLAGVRSDNHGGNGQNIINQDLSARYVTTCVATGRCQGDDRTEETGDHFYLNKKNDHAAGLGPDDVVLGRSEYTPLGRITPMSQSLAAGCSTAPVLMIHVTGLNGGQTAEREAGHDPRPARKERSARQ